MATFFGDEPHHDQKKPYRDAPEEPCPECGSWLLIFTGYEMFEDNPVARNFHCEECDTHFSEEYGDGPFE